MQIELNTVCTTDDKCLVVVTHVRQDGFLECRDRFSGETKTYYRSYLTPMPQIPSRFRETQFQQVADHVAAALANFPLAVRINPGNLSVDTFARKLREAIIAKKNYHWKWPTLDEALWAKHHEELQVSIEPEGTILMGSSASIRGKQVLTGRVMQAKHEEVSTVYLKDCESAELEQLCLLLHNRRFQPAPVFTVRGLSQDRIESLESRYDIAIVPTEGDETLFQILS